MVSPVGMGGRYDGATVLPREPRIVSGRSLRARGSDPVLPIACSVGSGMAGRSALDALLHRASLREAGAPPRRCTTARPSAKVPAIDLRVALIGVLVLELGVVSAAALVGGASPVLYALAAFVVIAVVVADLGRRHPVRTLLLAGPIVLGGAAAIALGASDHVLWLVSPALWLGIACSVAAGAWLVRTGRARPRDAIEGLAVGLVLSGLTWVALLAALSFWVFVWPGPS
jgi:hypothetical protein